MTVEQTTASPARGGLSPATTRPNWLILSIPLVLGLAVATRIGQLDASPHFDELYHLLAARGWLETGTFRIEDGLYERAALYTRLIAASLQTLGDTLELARLTSVVFGCALVLGIYLWLGAAAGGVAAGAGALLALLWPEGIVVSQMVRFYALHALLFFLGAAGVFHLSTAPPTWGRSILVGGGTILAFASAFYLQLITLIGLAGILTWVAAFVALPAVMAHRHRWWIVAAALAVAAGIAALAYGQGILDAAWERYRWVPDWAAARQHYETYYFDLLLTEYPAFWPLLLVGIVLGCALRPRLASFCATIFLVGFVLLSFGGMKHARYLGHLMPFFFMLVALAAAAAAGPLVRGLAATSLEALRRLVPLAATRRIAGLAVALALVFAFAVNPAVRHALALAAGGGSPQLDAADWSLARPVLQAHVDDGALVAAREEMKALHFLGRADLVVNGSRLSELDDKTEFATDFRTGLPVISQPESLRRVIECTPRGLFITGRWHFEENELFQTAAEGLEDVTVDILPLPEAAGLVAAAWTTATMDTAACARTDDLLGRTAGG